MKLQNVITFRLSILKAISIALWAVCFYFAIIKEINNETDEALTNYAENIITDYLAGVKLPPSNEISGNFYLIRNITADYARRHRHIRYKDTEVHFRSTYGYEPARSVTYIFQTDSGEYRELSVFTATIDKNELKQSILYWLIALYAVLLIGIISVNLWTVKHSMKPLKRLFDWLDSYKLGQNNTPLDNPTNITEFKKLNETVQKSTERNEQLYKQQKIFIANASHEMQTPLAVCTNRLEMLLDEDTLTENQMAEIIKTMRTLKNLSATNRSLLLLCKIDNGQFRNNVEIDLKDTVNQILPDLMSIYGHKHITINKDLTGAPVAEMDASLANTLIANLLKNAFIHNVTDGRIDMKTDENSLSIANTGASEPLDESKIFESFYHSADKKSSTGLGLALVKAVCRLYGFGIKYSFQDGMHVFKVLFPKNQLKDRTFPIISDSLQKHI